MDTITKVLGAIMIIVIFVVIIVVKPPVGSALKNTFVPEAGATNLDSCKSLHFWEVLLEDISLSPAHIV